MTSLGGERSQPNVMSFYGMLKIPVEFDKSYFVGHIQGNVLPTPCFADWGLCCNQRALVNDSEMITPQMGTHSRSESSSAWVTL
jgi:hypothetical protein